jgi:hypothetical protein
VLQLEVPKLFTAPVLLTVAAALMGAPAEAAAPPPESTATCYGSLAPAPTSDEPNSLDYKFHCDARITAYTILVNRRLNDFDTIDDFSTTASVIEPDGRTVDPTTSWSCEGYVPGASVNCNTGGGSSYMAAWSYSEGSLDPIDPYCKRLPPGAKPGTPAEPRALVQLVVTDTTGAQDGPFRLSYARTCPVVPNRVPPKSKHHKTQTTAAKGSK